MLICVTWILKYSRKYFVMAVFLNGFHCLWLCIYEHPLIVCLCLSFAGAKVEGRTRSQISPEAVKGQWIRCSNVKIFCYYRCDMKNLNCVTCGSLNIVSKHYHFFKFYKWKCHLNEKLNIFFLIFPFFSIFFASKYYISLWCKTI